MSRTLSSFLAERFGAFITDLRDGWGVDLRTLTEIMPVLKGIHRRYLSLACAATIAGERKPRGECIRRVVEAGYLVQVLGIKGLENPACFLLRQNVELVLRHIYFRTHPTEHAWSASREEYREIGFRFLVGYLQKTHEYHELRDENALCSGIEQQYAILSRHVHVHSPPFMVYSGTRRNTVGSKEQVVALEGRTRLVWPNLTFLTALFERDRFRKASTLEQTLIRKGFPTGYVLR